MNRTWLRGRLGREIELRKTQTGKSVTTFFVAVTTGYGDQQKTNWIRCIAWEKQADTLAQYSHKGDEVEIDGRLIENKYKDRDTGKEISTLEVRCTTVTILTRKSNQNSRTVIHSSKTAL